MNPVTRRLPTRLAITDTSPVQAGAGFGWVSCSTANLAGGTSQGSGFVAGAATISGGITAIAVSAGGSGYPVSARLQLTISGDGAGATGYAVTNSSGVVTSITIQSAGAGYTVMTAAVINAQALVTLLFDLGPDHDQYDVIDVGTVTGPYRMIFNGSIDGSANDRMLTSRDGSQAGTEAFFENIAASGSPARIARLCGMRFVRIQFYAGQATSAAHRLYLTMARS
jgi:hypothetical protein